ncbi:MAG: chemotaxis protein CheA, partial [Verrucomicrobiales bacterium VVV1]
MARNRQLTLNSVIVTEILNSRDALQALTQQVALALEKGQLPDKIVPVAHLIRAVKHLAATGGAALPVVKAVAAPVIAPVAAAVPVAPAAPEVEEVPIPVDLVALANEAAKPTATAVAASNGAAPKVAAGATVRVNTEKLDSLMDVVGELVIVQSQLLEPARQHGGANGSPLQRNVTHLSRLPKALPH